MNLAGYFLFEAAGSVHTVECIEDDARVWLQMYGINLNLDDDSNVASIDGRADTLALYRELCEGEGSRCQMLWSAER